MSIIRGEAACELLCRARQAMQIYVAAEFHWPEQLRASNSIEVIYFAVSLLMIIGTVQLGPDSQRSRIGRRLG